MTSPTNADIHHRLIADSRPQPPSISKDMLFPDSSVPLSPEWLLPKQGENRLVQGAGDLHPYGHDSADSMKTVRIREDLSGEKKKDVYRPSFHDIDGRRDRWHEEEREVNTTIRRDRRREGEKELVDSRKSRTENAYEQRRESKWNTRWGPDVKDSEHRREKWSGKDGESRDKEASNHGKNTHKEEDYHSRSWRLSPPLINERGETTTYLPLNQNKSIPNMGYGRGKGDNGVSVFSAGRGRATTNTFGMNIGSTHPLGTASERSNCSHGDTPILRYSRMKMLDIYRATNFKDYNKSFIGLVEVPSLMEAEPLEPLAINAPISDELVILKAIDKGDIVSSGASQASKDGSVGIMEDAISLSSTCREEASENTKNDNFVVNESSSFEKHSDFDIKVFTGRSILGYQVDKLTSEAFKHGSTSANDFNYREVQKFDATPLSSQSFGEQSLGASNDERYSEAVSISSDLDWLHSQKEVEVAPVGNNAALSYLKDAWRWQNSRSSHSEINVTEPSFRRQTSNIVEQEKDGSVLHGHGDSFTQRVKSGDTKLSQSLSPENLRLCYKDPQGHIQGPFSGSDLIGWFEAGYFGIDLQVRLANSPPDAPFSLLGDVIPQLRARVRPPPGFGMGRQNEFVEVLNKGKPCVPRDIYARAAELELLKNDRGTNIESKLQAENRFLESLMLGKTSSSDSESHTLGEGIDGYHPIVSVRPSFGAENMSNMNYLVHKMPLEQSRSLPTPYWPVKDLPDVVSSANFVNGYPTPHSKFPQMGEISHHMLQSSNHKELPSILHPTADKSPPVAISTTALPNLHEVQTLKYSHGSMDINKNTMDMNQSQQSINSHIGFGTPQSLQTKPQPSLSNLAQLGDFSGGVIAPEKFVTSEFTQDPQITHLLQQQYMLYQQLHSQVPLPAQNVSPLDLLLLMQRQKHEQQQKQFLLQQQQHLLSQVLSANQLQQLVNEVPLMHLRSGVNTEITTPDNLPLQKFQEELQSKLQIPAYGSEDSYKSGFINLSLHGAQDGSFTSSSEHSQSHLPNQIIEHISQQNLGDANGGRNQNLNSIQSALTGERLPNQLNSPNQIFELIPQRILTVANDESAQNSHAKRSVLLEECLPSAGEGSVEEAFLAQKECLGQGIICSIRGSISSH
ncbi:hypothetical protein HPP92_024929 [Vanilla planifolia]|uniref:GYF domain-containing protein n=1 Tax=Vanilla planifolia TaxID=51239 RepID=A0A835PT40_VANPL|nr:hypothetical protein HPP92_024929 [Vanilla planifolia]